MSENENRDGFTPVTTMEGMNKVLRNLKERLNQRGTTPEDLLCEIDIVIAATKVGADVARSSANEIKEFLSRLDQLKVKWEEETKQEQESENVDAELETLKKTFQETLDEMKRIREEFGKDHGPILFNAYED